MISVLALSAALAAVPVPELKEPAPSLALEFPTTHALAAGAAAAVVAVPVGLYLGTLWGQVPNSLIAAALPSLLAFAVIPPLAVTLAAWMVVNRLHDGAATVRPALWVNLLLHVGMMVGAIFLNVSSYNLTSVLALTAVEAVVLSTATAFSMRWSSPAPAGPSLAYTVRF